MTFSLLARDPISGALGGAAATGNLCVGAWVLRGKAGVGISASQGRFPSTLWGGTVLGEIERGVAPDQAIQTIVMPDGGRASRQLLVLDQNGHGAAFSGQENVPMVSEVVQPGICAGGNMLSQSDVVGAMADGFLSSKDSFLRRLLAGLSSGANAGGDARGLMSAAILIIAQDHPPIDIRVDVAEDPLKALSNLATCIEAEEYVHWMRALPTSFTPYPSH
ncbi:MAG: DUF1028 domain-containing protein [Pseudomonadota bacterium]